MTQEELNQKLFYASVLNDIKTAREVLAAGANVNKQDSDGYTALILACMYGYTDLVALILKYNADLSIENKYGWTAWTAFIKSASNEDINIFKLLIEYCGDIEINMKDSNGDTLLIASCRKGNVKLTELLLKHGADVNAKNDSGGTPLFSAALRGFAECVKLLINAGAEINLTDGDGWTALMYAAYYGNPVIMNSLIKTGADVNAKNNNGETAMDIFKNRNPDKYREWIKEAVTKPRRNKLRQEDALTEQDTGPDFCI